MRGAEGRRTSSAWIHRYLRHVLGGGVMDRLDVDMVECQEHAMLDGQQLSSLAIKFTRKSHG